MAIKNVLVVDDSPTDTHVLAEMLKKNGFNVLQAVSGEDGIEKAKSDKPDLVLMDVVMPGMNGFQATRKLTRGDETSHIPVIMVTTKDQDTDRTWGMRQGARDYVVKPVAGAELLAKIKAALNG